MSEAADDSPSFIERRLALRRWSRRGVFALTALLIASVLVGRAGLFGRAGDDWATFDRKAFDVSEVIDADTLLVSPDGGGTKTRVRLVGVDAPDEGAHGSAEAKQHLAALASGRRVTLRLEPTQTRAADGSLLAYVHPSDQDSVNLLMVRDGHAYADRRASHSFQSVFDQEEGEARRKARGLWQAVEESQMPPWRQQWLNELRQKKDANQRRPATTQAAPQQT
jgi:endonuclease YncB( thermonuclease family)